MTIDTPDGWIERGMLITRKLRDAIAYGIYVSIYVELCKLDELNFDSICVSI